MTSTWRLERPLAPEMFHFTACPSILPDPETFTKHLIYLIVLYTHGIMTGWYSNCSWYLSAEKQTDLVFYFFAWAAKRIESEVWMKATTISWLISQQHSLQASSVVSSARNRICQVSNWKFLATKWLVSTLVSMNERLIFFNSVVNISGQMT